MNRVKERVSMSDVQVKQAVAELRSLICQQYPSATFEITHGHDPEGVYLTPTVDVGDTEEVFDVVADRLLEMQVDQGLPVYVIPVRPLARVIEDLRPRHDSQPDEQHSEMAALGLSRLVCDLPDRRVRHQRS